MKQMFQNGNIRSINPLHVVSYIIYLLRFNPLPEVGQKRGLDLILDAHTNLVMKSSVVDSFQVKSNIHTFWIVKNYLRLSNPCFHFETLSSLDYQTCISLHVLTKTRVGTGGVRGNQIHSGVIWTLKIPKMWLSLKSNVGKFLVLKLQGCQVTMV